MAKTIYHIKGYTHDESADVAEIRADITNIKGDGYVDETIKGNADDITTKITA